MAWFVQIMGEMVGPYSNAEFKRLADTGRVQPDSPVARDRVGPWVMAAAVKGLFDGAADTAVSSAAKVDDERTTTPTSTVSEATAKGQRYKVLTQRDRYFAGKFDPDRLEDAINAYADDGWRVCGMATTLFTSLAGKREEVLVLMERIEA